MFQSIFLVGHVESKKEFVKEFISDRQVLSDFDVLCRDSSKSYIALKNDTRESCKAEYDIIIIHSVSFPFGLDIYMKLGEDWNEEWINTIDEIECNQAILISSILFLCSYPYKTDDCRKLLTATIPNYSMSLIEKQKYMRYILMFDLLHRSEGASTDTGDPNVYVNNMLKEITTDIINHSKEEFGIHFVKFENISDIYNIIHLANFSISWFRKQYKYIIDKWEKEKLVYFKDNFCNDVYFKLYNTNQKCLILIFCSRLPVSVQSQT